MRARPLYRARQFWQALSAQPTQEDLDEIETALTPAQMHLFLRMQPGEQAHSIEIYHRLRSQGEEHPDLLTAALLHDAGKSLYRLRLWERVWIVAGQALFPDLAERWGEGGDPARITASGDLPGKWWRRPFIVAAQHPAWGADLAAEAGASELAVTLIRRHQNLFPSQIVTIEDSLLQKLQAVDGSS